MRSIISIDPKRLKLKRLENGFSIRKLEKLSTVSKATIIDLEKGNRRAEEYTLFKLSKALGCNMEELEAYKNDK